MRAQAGASFPLLAAGQCVRQVRIWVRGGEVFFVSQARRRTGTGGIIMTTGIIMTIGSVLMPRRTKKPPIGCSRADGNTCLRLYRTLHQTVPNSSPFQYDAGGYLGADHVAPIFAFLPETDAPQDGIHIGGSESLLGRPGWGVLPHFRVLLWAGDLCLSPSHC